MPIKARLLYSDAQPPFSMFTLRVSVLLAVVTGSLAGTVRGQMFTGIGYLPGGYETSDAQAVSNNGVVVGVSSSPGMNSEAFRWSARTGMIGMGALGPSTGLRGSGANGVSSDGRVIVGASSAPGGSQAFRWTSDAGMVGLGDLPGGPVYSYGMGVSGDGTVVIGDSQSTNGFEAIRWTSEAGMQGLGDLPGGTFHSLARGVSSDGSVIVGLGRSVDGFEAFRWTAADGMTGLGFLEGGTPRSNANAVSADGSTIVGAARPNVQTIEAIRWTNDLGLQELGFLPGGDWSEARGVSGDGSMVVGTAGSPLGFEGLEAFVWTPESGMQRLIEVLVEDYGLGDDLAGWRLHDAFDVSANGRYIVGTGRNPDGTGEGWMVDLQFTPVPEPSFYGAFAAGLLGLMMVWRRRTHATRCSECILPVDSRL